MYLRDLEGSPFHNYSRYSKTKHMSGLINSPSFVRAIEVLGMCILDDAAYIDSEVKFLPHLLQHIRIDAATACLILSFTCVKSRG